MNMSRVVNKRTVHKSQSQEPGLTNIWLIHGPLSLYTGQQRTFTLL